MGLTPGLSPALLPPALKAQQVKEQSAKEKIASQYQGLCSCADCNRFETADAMLQAIRAEQESHIMAHESAHKSAAGAFGGSIVIERDGNGIAVGGHVPITIPPLDNKNPEVSMRSYQTIRNAALAPGDPSGQDLAVASHAQALAGQAQVLMSQKRAAQSPSIQKAGQMPGDLQRQGLGQPPEKPKKP